MSRIREHIGNKHSSCKEGKDYLKAAGLFLCLECDETRKTLGKIKRHIFTVHREPIRDSDPNSEDTSDENIREPRMKRTRSSSPFDSIDGLILSDEEDHYQKRLKTKR